MFCIQPYAPPPPPLPPDLFPNGWLYCILTLFTIQLRPAPYEICESIYCGNNTLCAYPTLGYLKEIIPMTAYRCIQVFSHSHCTRKLNRPTCTHTFTHTHTPTHTHTLLNSMLPSANVKDTACLIVAALNESRE